MKAVALKIALAVASFHRPVVVATLTVDSTAYCQTGATASGQRTHDGIVAMNGVPFGTRWRILTGSLAGKIVTVEDRYGHGTQFDVWVASCAGAARYGRQRIQIGRLR